ncbi:MAG: hypothetical protein Q9220_006475 [cf. Caloplaca sp. 1 TL-2023]
MAKYPLAGLVVAATGDFGPRRSHQVLQRWTEKNGGRWETRMNMEVTHLVCSKADYQAKVPMDTLMKGYRLAAKGEYLLERSVRSTMKKKQQKKQKIKAGVEDFKRECTEIQNQLFSDRYHIYRDSTAFAYDIILVRINIEQNKSERYVLRVSLPISYSYFPFPPLIPHTPKQSVADALPTQLCTTHDTPKYYATLLIYQTPGFPVHKSILAPIGSDWEKAFLAFMKAFKAKTKLEWEERLLVPPAIVREEGAFVYSPPKLGEARGLVERDFEVGN